MYVKNHSAILQGLDSIIIGVETHISKGIPAFGIVGLAGKSINEARERVSIALKSSDFPMPPQRITVNLTPAHTRKEGPQLDLALAAGLMVSFEYVKCSEDFLEQFCFLGELSLTGELRAFKGALPLALKVVEEKIKYLVLPYENAKEASLATLRDDCETEIFAVKNLNELKILIEELDSYNKLEQGSKPAPNKITNTSPIETSQAKQVVNLNTMVKQIYRLDKQSTQKSKNTILNKFKIQKPNQEKIQQYFYNKSKELNKENFADVVGQRQAKRGLEIAAAGRHHCLMIGPPGCGKSMLAKRFINLLPELSFNEALETTKIYSVSGLLKETLVTHSPLRAPHHSITSVSLIGRGVPPMPGEVSLSHNGVLFLDELTEFNRYSLEQLRQILEDKQIVLNKSNQTHIYPADFVLVTACNPCPCGFLGDDIKPCTCSPSQISRYISKLSGPFLDRIDLHMQLNRLNQEEMFQLGSPKATVNDQLKDPFNNESMKERVNKARFFEAHLIKDLLNLNLDVKTQLYQMDKASQKMLLEASCELEMSARSHQKITKIARTIANMEESSKIAIEHIAEALQYRSMDWDPYRDQSLRFKGSPK